MTESEKNEFHYKAYLIELSKIKETDPIMLLDKINEMKRKWSIADE